MLSNLLFILLTLLGISLPGTAPVGTPSTGAVPTYRGEEGIPAADWPPASAPGRLAFVGADGNVYVTVILQGRPAPATAITLDATAAPEGRGRSYHRIAWAYDGRPAFAAVERGRRTVGSELYIVAPDQAPQLAGAHPERHVIYMHWAPEACTTCPDLIYLVEGENALDLRRVDISPATVTPEKANLGRRYSCRGARGATLCGPGLVGRLVLECACGRLKTVP